MTARTRTGLVLGLSAYGIWGLLPLYFKLLAAVPPSAIVAHRILWSVILLGVLASLMRRWNGIGAAIRAPRVLATLMVTAVLIAINWLAYIWAIVNGHVLAGSLGYYLNPLVNVLFGTLLLKERLTRAQGVAVALAGAGVAVLAVGAGSGLWVSLLLAFSFASYGFLRKVAPVEAVEGLWIETALLAPVALGWVLYLGPAGGFPTFGMQDVLLILGGAVTAVPLLLFTAAAKRLPYSTLGFLQYIAPTMQFALAVLLFGERLTAAHLVCFAMIWAALAIFMGEALLAGRRAARARAEQAEACRAAAELS